MSTTEQDEQTVIRVSDAFRAGDAFDQLIAEGYVQHNPQAGVDIFRIGGDGKIIEHWDVLQSVAETTVSGNDVFSHLSSARRRSR